ncbi:hypothetical protein U1Q18_012057 [Sarracenia purpurea var. burkii]
MLYPVLCASAESPPAMNCQLAHKLCYEISICHHHFGQTLTLPPVATPLKFSCTKDHSLELPSTFPTKLTSPQYYHTRLIRDPSSLCLVRRRSSRRSPVVSHRFPVDWCDEKECQLIRFGVFNISAPILESVGQVNASYVSIFCGLLLVQLNEAINPLGSVTTTPAPPSIDCRWLVRNQSSTLRPHIGFSVRSQKIIEEWRRLENVAIERMV